eukprot:symbB.v1.2.011838.t1/scaffold803.1/size162902/10
MRGIRARLGAAGNSDEDEDPEECILTPCWMSSFKEALERAWQAIERAASSEEDLCEVDMQREVELPGNHWKDAQRISRGHLSAAEVFDSSPIDKSVNAFFDIGDDDGPVFQGPSGGGTDRSKGQAPVKEASETSNILEL